VVVKLGGLYALADFAAVNMVGVVQQSNIVEQDANPNVVALEQQQHLPLRQQEQQHLPLQLPLLQFQPTEDVVVVS
jgi:hypothetical protein